ncbi:Glycosyltransferase, catalytic subunit of cellulose synthase and poly-beta-1,6-N-acetylglucosamine synthase [Micromonospora narathiwatensis]|uniref:Glycosyltransferase, catalytic subunit of cellulose synthase and poly-beta-1,6-N-acetylglucosamine synthase n=1 Tax=Micromonospora narathiwatensis TaxID=299146 RepID=A0A1A9A718_9ACTN|nr:Glycosyltransferase, catalytic subunit of cellulose synthase and poly-beta-1,6-N-acetylglucosamine synthase [Micromonospora narathiwatensis]
MAVAAETRVSPARKKGPSRAGPPTTHSSRPAPDRRPDRRQLNIGARLAYARCGATAGPLVAPRHPRAAVEFRRVASPTARVILTLLVLVNSAAGLLFIGWLLLPEHVPGSGVIGLGDWRTMAARLGFCVVVGVELIRLAQNVVVWVFAFNAKDPVPVDPPVGLRVALLTTIVPSKEPLDVAERTLRRLRQLVYCGQVDVWILDEGDDPAVKAMAARLGVRHFSRRGRPEYNQPTGEFRARTKSGNHNAWRAEHEHRYDVVANVDPDHVPLPNFLERTLGYFRDPDVAFVVTPQVYGNMHQNFVAHGASVQQYLYNGLIARGGNGLDAPLLTGTGHLYRPAAWRSIGGYQDSIIEDHLTSIRVHAATNPETGNRWKGVYTPDVVAIGEGPTSWADYFNQQKRWAAGICEILVRPELRAPRTLPSRRRWQYRLLQFYYPSVAVSLLLGNVATAMYLLTGVSTAQLDVTVWSMLWGSTLGTWFVLWLWLRRFNIAPHEREEIGMVGMALALFAGPVYVAAGVGALLRRKLGFVVTAKGKLRTIESLGTFRLHFCWAAVAAGLLGASVVLGNDFTLLRVWPVLTILTGLGPPLIALVSNVRARRQQRDDPAELPARAATEERPAPTARVAAHGGARW